MLKDVLKQGDFLTKINLKDAYHTIPIPPSTILTFRVGTQKILKPVVGHLRKLGIRLLFIHAIYPICNPMGLT